MGRAAKRKATVRAPRAVQVAEADIGRHVNTVLGRLYVAGSIDGDALRAGAEIAVAMELAQVGTAPCAIVDPTRLIVDGGPGYRDDPLHAPRLRLVADLGRWGREIDQRIAPVGGVTAARFMYTVLVGAVPGDTDADLAAKGRKPGSLRYLERQLGIRNGGLVGPISLALQIWIDKPWERQRRMTTIR
jgi:hypothetical protein